MGGDAPRWSGLTSRPGRRYKGDLVIQETHIAFIPHKAGPSAPGFQCELQQVTGAYYYDFTEEHSWLLHLRVKDPIPVGAQRTHDIQFRLKQANARGQAQSQQEDFSHFREQLQLALTSATEGRVHQIELWEETGLKGSNQSPLLRSPSTMACISELPFRVVRWEEINSVLLQRMTPFGRTCDIAVISQAPSTELALSLDGVDKKQAETFTRWMR